VLGLATPVHEGLTVKIREDRLLTPRQLEILRFLAEGSNTDAIAAELGIALETVRNHIRALLRRLGVHSRLEAVATARRHGLLRVRDQRGDRE
jgi:two-component system nitrate/nitrite response regulator NarL